MKKPKVNLAHYLSSKKPAKKIFLAGKFFIYAVTIIGLLLTSLTYKAVFSEDGIAENWSKLNIVGQIKHLMDSNDKLLKGEKEDRINILLLGIGGAGHEGGTLTDTNIIMSFKPSSGQVAMLSIPRDLYVPLADYDVWRKINSANSYGEYYQPGSGAEVARRTVEKIFDIPIHYYLRVDFEGFKKVIDEFGGIDIYVENTLDDYQYPIKGKENSEPYEERFEHLHIDNGWQSMDGELALKYARSRHAVGQEGSDFARSKRQQKVILALNDKVFKLNTLLNIKKINSLLSLLNNNIKHNMEIWEILRLAELDKKNDNQNIINQILDNGPQGLLYATVTEDGAYVLRPRAGDWSSARFLAANIFTKNLEMPSDNSLIEKRTPSKAKILSVEIQNGTTQNGFAKKTSELLAKQGYQITRIGNAAKQNYKQTVIYDLTEGQKLNNLSELRNLLKANIALTLPGWLNASLLNSQEKINSGQAGNNLYGEKPESEADFLIILGQNTISLIFDQQMAQN